MDFRSVNEMIHFILSWLEIFYPFFFQVKVLDFIFLGIAIIIPFGWSLFNGECLISYLEKKRKDPTYVAGSVLESTDIKEIYNSIFGESDLLYPFVGVLMALTGIVYVLLRLGFSLGFTLLVFTSWMSLKLLKERRSDVINYTHSLIFAGILFAIFYSWKTNTRF